MVCCSDKISQMRDWWNDAHHLHKGCRVAAGAATAIIAAIWSKKGAVCAAATTGITLGALYIHHSRVKHHDVCGSCVNCRGTEWVEAAAGSFLYNTALALVTLKSHPVLSLTTTMTCAYSLYAIYREEHLRNECSGNQRDKAALFCASAFATIAIAYTKKYTTPALIALPIAIGIVQNKLNEDADTVEMPPVFLGVTLTAGLLSLKSLGTSVAPFSGIRNSIISITQGSTFFAAAGILSYGTYVVYNQDD